MEIWLWCFYWLKRAFDTVNHSVSLRKPDHYGIRGIALDWLFSSYISERKQYVSVNGHISDYLDIFVVFHKALYLELKYVKQWLDANKLALNMEKTNFVLFHFAVKKITEPIVLKFRRKK